MAQVKIIEMPGFTVVGVSVKTTNQGMQSQKDISNLWGLFVGQNLVAQIHDKTSPDIYCIYTDYESDFNGPYTTLLGCRVNSLRSIPNGLIARAIPASTYQVYRSTGKLPDSVVKTWAEIWRSGIKRKYIADFDVYGINTQNPEQTAVDTYVSI
jgi:predicted transcriptional regulator YdeE